MKSQMCWHMLSTVGSLNIQLADMYSRHKNAFQLDPDLDSKKRTLY